MSRAKKVSPAAKKAAKKEAKKRSDEDVSDMSELEETVKAVNEDTSEDEQPKQKHAVMHEDGTGPEENKPSHKAEIQFPTKLGLKDEIDAVENTADEVKEPRKSVLEFDESVIRDLDKKELSKYDMNTLLKVLMLRGRDNNPALERFSKNALLDLNMERQPRQPSFGGNFRGRGGFRGGRGRGHFSGPRHEQFGGGRGRSFDTRDQGERHEFGSHGGRGGRGGRVSRFDHRQTQDE